MVGQNQAKANKLNHGIQQAYNALLTQMEKDRKKRIHAADRDLAEMKIFLGDSSIFIILSGITSGAL